MDTTRARSSASRHRLLATILALPLLAALLATAPAPAASQNVGVGDLPAEWEVSPQPVSTWGVATLLPSETVVFRSLVWDFAEIDGVVYVAGRFGHVSSGWQQPLIDQAYLAAFDADTGVWIDSFRPELDGPVFALEADDDRLYVGGEFTSVDGVATGPLVELDPDSGDLEPGFAPAVAFPAGRALVMDLDIANDSLYVGGNFSSVVNAITPRLAKLDLDTGAHDTTFGGAASGARVWTIEASPTGDRLYVGGYFEVLNGQPLKWFGALDGLTGELVPGVNQGTPGGMPNCCKQNPFDIAVHGDKVFVARESHLLEILDADGLERVGWYLTSFGGGDYQATEVIGDRLYAGGHYWANQAYGDTPIDPNHTSWLQANLDTLEDPSQTHAIWASAFDADTGAAQPSFLMDMGAASGVWAIHGSENGRLWLGGDITRAGTRWAGGFATFAAAPDTDRGDLLSLGATTSASSVRDTFGPGFAVDRHLAGQLRHDGLRTNFAETLVENDPWIELDLGTTRDVGVVRLFERAVGNFNGMSNGRLFLSEQPFASTDPDTTAADPNVTTIPVGNIGRWVELDANVSARYIRYQLPGDARQLTADSIEVFEATGPVDPPGLAGPDARITRVERRLAVLNYDLVAGADGYEILLDGQVIATDDNRWHVVRGLEPDTSYEIGVRAVANGQAGATTTLSITTAAEAAPDAPDARITRVERRLAVVNYQWVNGADDYEILLDGRVIATDDDRWYVVRDLEPGTSYTIGVRAVDDGRPGAITELDITTEP